MQCVRLRCCVGLKSQIWLLRCSMKLGIDLGMRSSSKFGRCDALRRCPPSSTISCTAEKAGNGVIFEIWRARRARLLPPYNTLSSRIALVTSEWYRLSRLSRTSWYQMVDIRPSSSTLRTSRAELSKKPCNSCSVIVMKVYNAYLLQEKADTSSMFAEKKEVVSVYVYIYCKQTDALLSTENDSYVQQRFRGTSELRIQDPGQVWSHMLNADGSRFALNIKSSNYSSA